jgi:hypothetical protein
MRRGTQQLWNKRLFVPVCFFPFLVFSIFRFHCHSVRTPAVTVCVWCIYVYLLSFIAVIETSVCGAEWLIYGEYGKGTYVWNQPWTNLSYYSVTYRESICIVFHVITQALLQYTASIRVHNCFTQSSLISTSDHTKRWQLHFKKNYKYHFFFYGNSPNQAQVT